MHGPIRVQRRRLTQEEVLAILATVPAWFGIERANREYAAAAERMPGYVAITSAGTVAGCLLLARHYPTSGEVHLLAVRGELHGQGIGRCLIEEVEHDLRTDGARLLSVKTLGPSHPDGGYASTRRFYEALGFLPLEELQDLWPGYPCLVMVKPLR